MTVVSRVPKEKAIMDANKKAAFDQAKKDITEVIDDIAKRIPEVAEHL